MLRAGFPNIVIPHGMDQQFLGGCVAKLGVGAKPIRISELTASSLSSAILQVDDPEMRFQAQRIGSMIQAEDGVGQAIHIIEQHVADFNRRKN